MVVERGRRLLEVARCTLGAYIGLSLRLAGIGLEFELAASEGSRRDMRKW
jgi:hypothetical protein